MGPATKSRTKELFSCNGENGTMEEGFIEGEKGLRSDRGGGDNAGE
jgi:hypothetical protein